MTLSEYVGQVISERSVQQAARIITLVLPDALPEEASRTLHTSLYQMAEQPVLSVAS